MARAEALLGFEARRVPAPLVAAVAQAKDAGPEFEQPLGDTEAGYQLTVKGDPGFHTEMSIGLYAGCAVTALHPINAINAVCAARPGILGQLDMPHFYWKNVRRG